MNCQFLLSKDNKQICSYNNKFLHSTYSPEREAERFVNSIQKEFEPSFIVFTGPCLPYSIPFLINKFSCAKIIAIQYTTDFTKFNNSFFATIELTTKTTANEISEKLFNLIGEENILSTLFISWQPSETAFPNEYKTSWNAIKKTVEKCNAILNTRSFFNLRWLKNTVKFFNNTKTFAKIAKTDLPVIITASGPSLKNALPFIKQNKKNAIIVSLSSSLSVLLENDIIPDFVMTTDGGYWAKEHLKALQKCEQKIPIITPPEANVPFFVLRNFPVVPLQYGDDLASLFFGNLSERNNVLLARRNGTVAGTAVELFLSLTSGNIYFAGLDLAPSKGFSHTQPNELLKNCNADFKLSSTENRISPSTFKNGSLLIYRNWFETRNDAFYKRVFRLVSDDNNLEQIKNLTDLFVNQVKIDNQNDKKVFIKTEQSKFFGNNKIKELLNKEREKILNSNYNAITLNGDFWFKSCALIDYLKMLKMQDFQKEQSFKSIVEKTTKTIDSLLKL